MYKASTTLDLSPRLEFHGVYHKLIRWEGEHAVIQKNSCVRNLHALSCRKNPLWNTTKIKSSLRQFKITDYAQVISETGDPQVYELLQTRYNS